MKPPVEPIIHGTIPSGSYQSGSFITVYDNCTWMPDDINWLSKYYNQATKPPTVKDNEKE